MMTRQGGQRPNVWTLPPEQVDALLRPTAVAPEKAQAVHQLNSAFLGAPSFEAVETMAQQVCRPDVVTAACELLISGDPMGWSALIFLRYIGYCEGACELLVKQGVVAATVGTLRSWVTRPDHRTQLALELLIVLLGRPANERGSPEVSSVLTSFAKCGGCGVACSLAKQRAQQPPPLPPPEGGAPVVNTQELALELLEIVSQGPVEPRRHLDRALERVGGDAWQPSSLAGRYPAFAMAVQQATPAAPCSGGQAHAG